MFIVEPAGLGEEDVELRAVGVTAVVCHGNPAGRTVGQHKLLVVKALPEDAAACGRNRRSGINKGNRRGYRMS